VLLLSKSDTNRRALTRDLGIPDSGTQRSGVFKPGRRRPDVLARAAGEFRNSANCCSLCGG
jgi:hypothetical protein